MHSNQQTGCLLSFVAAHKKAEGKQTFGTSYTTRDKNPFRICLFRMFRKYTAAVRLDQSALAGSLCSTRCRARVSIDYSSTYLCTVAFLSHHANNIFFMKHTWEAPINVESMCGDATPESHWPPWAVVFPLYSQILFSFFIDDILVLFVDAFGVYKRAQYNCSVWRNIACIFLCTLAVVGVASKRYLCSMTRRKCKPFLRRAFFSTLFSLWIYNFFHRQGDVSTCFRCKNPIELL